MAGSEIEKGILGVRTIAIVDGGMQTIDILSYPAIKSMYEEPVQLPLLLQILEPIPRQQTMVNAQFPRAMRSPRGNGVVRARDHKKSRK
ncbi:MAG: hypothetical protein RLZZ283_442 [Candidatus Parcubacteria bacterium]